MMQRRPISGSAESGDPTGPRRALLRSPRPAKLRYSSDDSGRVAAAPAQREGTPGGVTVISDKFGVSPDAFRQVRGSLGDILTQVRTATDLKGGEAALDAVADVLGLPLVSWVPDTSHPYALPEADAYARSRGWPQELLDFWQSRHAALKMPLYIRCRFESLPFVASPDDRRHRDTAPVSREQTRITTVIRGMGVTSFAVVPLHMAKGQVAMVVWAGKRGTGEVCELMSGIEGDLLAIGHHFMRVATHSLQSAVDERSRLTPREWDCARTLAQGYREAEIASIIGISKLTVRFHLDNVVEKFGCKTRAQAIALLAQLGLLGPIGA
jgi:DNA-binding CsgD family transcriptional regulator